MAATRLPKAAAVGSIGCAAGGEDGTIPAADELSSAVVVVGGGLVVVDGGLEKTWSLIPIPGCYDTEEGEGDRDEREPAASEGVAGVWEAP